MGLVLIGTIFSKSLIQFSVDGWGCVPSLLFTWGQSMVDLMKIMATSFKRSLACAPTLQQATANPCLHRGLLDTPGQVWVSLLWGLCSFSWVLVNTRFCLCLPRVCFPVLCKFWWLHSGVSGNLLQKGLCHIRICCTQSPCPCGSPLLTCTSPGDIQTQFCLSLCGVSGSWCVQGLFEPSERL